MITDKNILEYFIKPSGIITSAAIKNAPVEYIEYLNNRYSDSQSIKETIRRIEHNIENRPVCPHCGKPVKFIGLRDKLFGTYCSNYCQTHDIQTKEKTKETCLEKYGVEHIGKSDTIKEKRKRTCLEKYGVDCVGKIEEFHKKRIETNLNKYGYYYNIEQYKKTCKERYGNEYAIASEHCKQKSIETCLSKYGVKYSSQISSVVEFMKTNKERINRIIISKRNNHSFNTSKLETESYKLLSDKFTNVITQYTSEKYPFNCDFYIPEIDTYIECNYHWTHGGHLYNEAKDIDTLSIWTEKSKTSNYYKNAIETWTIRDIKKYKTALSNELNYYICWTINDLIKLLDKL